LKEYVVSLLSVEEYAKQEISEGAGGKQISCMDQIPFSESLQSSFQYGFMPLDQAAYYHILRPSCELHL
jgi:hypothetical protein